MWKDHYWWMLIYFAAANLAAVIMTIYDKQSAIHHTRRVRESTLMITAALSGGIGMFITMKLVRHKTRHKKFMIGIPLIILAEAAAVFLLIYFGIV